MTKQNTTEHNRAQHNTTQHNTKQDKTRQKIKTTIQHKTVHYIIIQNDLTAQHDTV